VLPTIPREKLIVQTKIGPTETAAEFLETFEVSMKNLQLDHVDLLSVHGINTQGLLEKTLQAGGCMEACRQLQREGRVKSVGFSTHAPVQVIVNTVETGEFDYVNLHWYWVNRRNWPAVEAAIRQDMGVFIISPNDKGGKLYSPPPKLAELCKPLTPMIFNDLFCLQRPEVHTLSIGAAKPSDFDEHLRAVEMLNQADTLVPPIDQKLTAALSAAMGDEWMANWDRGIPEADHIPGEINVWEILRLYNLAKGLDLVDFGKMRYNLLGNADHWFPGKPAADFKDDDLRAALSDSPFCDRIPSMLRDAHALLLDAPKARLSA
jgi:predicted aldo/keto reductase-like oxidoreductase